MHPVNDVLENTSNMPVAMMHAIMDAMDSMRSICQTVILDRQQVGQALLSCLVVPEHRVNQMLAELLDALALEHLLPLNHCVPVADQQVMPVVHAMHCAAAGAVAALELDVGVDVVEQPG